MQGAARSVPSAVAKFRVWRMSTKPACEIISGRTPASHMASRFAPTFRAYFSRRARRRIRMSSASRTRKPPFRAAKGSIPNSD